MGANPNVSESDKWKDEDPKAKTNLQVVAGTVQALEIIVVNCSLTGCVYLP